MSGHHTDRVPARVSAAVFAENLKGELLLLRRAPKLVGAGLFSPPGGGGKLGEDPISTVLRESKEETNLDIDLLGLMAIVTVPTKSGTTRVGFVFRGKIRDFSVLKYGDEVAGHDFFSRGAISFLL